MTLAQAAARQPNPPWATPRPRPTNAAMMPATMNTRCSRVAEISCAYMPTPKPAAPAIVASRCSRTISPVANATTPAAKVKAVRLFCTGCRWPSLFSVTRGRWARDWVLAASGIAATLRVTVLAVAVLSCLCRSSSRRGQKGIISARSAPARPGRPARTPSLMRDGCQRGPDCRCWLVSWRGCARPPQRRSRGSSCHGETVTASVQRRQGKRMRRYEMMIILDPSLEERTVQPSLEQFLKVITTGGGSVDKIDVWGRRRLAYEIDKKSEGIYTVIDVMAEPGTIKELDRQLNLNEAVLRTKILRPDLR